MTYYDPQTFGADMASPRESGTTTSVAVLIERIRRALAAALVVGLIALPVLGGRDATQLPQLQSDTSIDEPAIEIGPVFDGRGKWAGYAR